MHPMQESEIEAALRTLAKSWQVQDGKLTRRFTFERFSDAMAFMCQVAIEADKRDHHPEWFNVYNRVDVWLTTHDAGGITTRDFELAHEMERAAGA